MDWNYAEAGRGLVQKQPEGNPRRNLSADDRHEQEKREDRYRRIECECLPYVRLPEALPIAGGIVDVRPRGALRIVFFVFLVEWLRMETDVNDRKENRQKAIWDGSVYHARNPVGSVPEGPDRVHGKILGKSSRTKRITAFSCPIDRHPEKSYII